MKRAFIPALTIAMSLLLLPREGEAARSRYGQARQIKVCNLLVPSTARLPGAQAYLPQGQNRAPFLWHVADRRTDLKPEDWEFVNPLAPPVLNAAQIARWQRIGLGAAAAGRTFAIGSPLTPDMAPYWEVTLAPENLQALKEMNLVYISASGSAGAAVSFTLAEREMLRRLADSGVLVWIDNAGDLRINTSPTAPGDFFVPLDFTGIGGGTLSAVEIGHPLLNSVFRLTSAEIRGLGGSAAIQAGINIFPTQSGPEPVLIPVVQGASPSICAARYGSGFVVATAGSIGRAVSWLEGAGGNPNIFAFSRPDLTLSQNEDLKLLYNMVGWTAESPQYQRSPRHHASTSAFVNGLLERWSLSFVLDPPTPAEREAQAPNWVPPLLTRDLFYGVLPRAGRYSLHALEINPFNDFNGDGNPDDGPPALQGDLSLGRAYDEIGRANLPLSVVGGIAMGEKHGRPVLFVAGGGPELGNQLAPGTVLAYPAPTPALPTFGAPAIFEKAAPQNPPGRTLWAPPVYADGLLYVAGGYPGAPGNTTGAEGIVRVLELTDAGLIERWHYPASSAPTSIGPIVSAPVVARVQDGRTGAVDEVLFFTSVQSAASPGGLGGIVISTRGEPLQSVNDARTWAPNRRTEPWDPQGWWDIRVVNNATGQTAARYVLGGLARVEFNVDNQPGRIRLPDAFDPSQFSVYADYSPAGTQDAGSRALARRYWLPAFTIPGQTPTPTGIAGGPAVGPDDTVYYATGNGYIAAAQFVGGIPVLRWKVRTANAAPFTGQSNLVDPRNPQQFADYQFVASPAVGNDMAYFAGRDGIVYAFETTTNFTMKVPSPNIPGQPQRAPMSSSRGANLILYSNEATQPRTNRVPPDSYIVNADAGTVTLTNFRNLTLDLSQVQRYPQLGGRLGVALDVDYIDVNGNQVQDTCFLPINLAFTFSQQRLGGRPTRFSTPPVLAGNRVYVAGEDGVLYEFPADPRTEDPSFPTGGDVADFKNGALIRSRELSPNPLLAPPVIGHGTVAVATAEGITAFAGARVSVADGNRIVEVAADSTALSATEATEKHHLLDSQFPIPTDPQHAVIPAGSRVVTTKKDLNRPARVVRLNRQRSLVSAFISSNVTEAGTIGEHSEIAETSTLVADTGNNRVVEYNQSGKVVWEATTFQDPFRLLPPGEKLSLSEPHDVQRWVDTAPDPVAPNGPPLLVFHTLIADTGNRRVIELVDKVRYRRGQFTPDSFVTLPGQVDAQGQPVRWYRVLVWSSQTNAQGLSLPYRTAQRVPLTDAAGTPLRNPGRAPGTVAPAEATVPPYLAPEPYQSATLVSVSNTQIWFDNDPQSPNYRTYTLKNIPLVRPGGDSIFFLRNNRVDPDTGSLVPLRAPDPGAPEGSSNVIYVMGTIDRNLPVFREIWAFNPATGRDEIVRTLSGVSSVQRTVGVRRLFSPSGDVTMGRAVWYLVADAGGVFEFRFDPSLPAPPPGSQLDPRVRLAWAFTNDDYNWCTGGGNGNRDGLRQPGTGPDAGRYIGGRGLTAASAQRLPSGQVLIVSRTTSNPEVVPGPQGLGGDIFTLRVSDYNPASPTGGWAPDRWVQTLAGIPQNQQRPPSIAWRAPAPLNPAVPPSAARGGAYNPLEIGGTYSPEQPLFADLVF